MKYISISIDIVNSTYLKTKINELLKNQDAIDKKHEEIYSRLIDWGYSLLREMYAHKIAQELFLVKSIGDENWFIIDASKVTKKKVKALIDKLQDIAIESYPLNLTNKIKNNSTVIIYPKDVICSLKIKNKITIDLIKKNVDLQKVYRAQFRKFMQLATKSSLEQQEDREEMLKIFSYNFGVNIDQTDIDGKNVYNTERRFDIIGSEVDRFFRITKFAIPGLVVCGDTLYSEYLDEMKSIKEKKNKGEMKGVGSDYIIHYLPKKDRSYDEHPEAQRKLIENGVLNNQVSINKEWWMNKL